MYRTVFRIEKSESFLINVFGGMICVFVRILTGSQIVYGGALCLSTSFLLFVPIFFTTFKRTH
jgi:hypothetical protein